MAILAAWICIFSVHLFRIGNSYSIQITVFKYRSNEGKINGFKKLLSNLKLSFLITLILDQAFLCNLYVDALNNHLKIDTKVLL